MDMFKLITFLKIVSPLYNNCSQETANEVHSCLGLCSDVIAACSLILSKELHKLKCTVGDRGT